MASTEPQSTSDAVPEPQSTTTPSPTTTPLPTSIVILGGNHAGLGVLHTLARHTLPALQRLPSQPSPPQYKITLITPNSHFFFKPASPRALIHPDLLPGGEDKVFRNLSDAVKQYGELVTVVKAYATDVDTTKKEVKIKHVDPNSPPDSEGTSAVRYDVLIIATGTKARSALWTLPGPETDGLHAAEDATKREWEGIRTKLRNLQADTHPHHSILIAGGGPVGVETTGEIATLLKAEGKTEGVTITLLSGSDRLLNRNCNESLGRKAEAYLKKNFGSLVQVTHGIKVVSVSDSVIEGGVEQSETTVELSDGTTRTVGLYIDATGGSGTADGFLPQTWLDASSRVITKDAFFRVRGSGSGSDENDAQAAAADGIYAVGDVVSGSDNTLISTNFQVPVVCSSVGADLAAKILHPKGQTSSSVKLPAPLKQKTFKNKMAGTLLVPIGPDGGVGQILGWGVPSLMVKAAKAKNFLIDMAEPAVTGSQWK